MHPEAPAVSTVSRVAGIFRRYLSTSPVVGAPSTRNLQQLALNLSQALGVAVTPNDVRLAAGADARIRIDLAGRTNIKCRRMLRRMPKRRPAAPVELKGREASPPTEESAGVGGAL